MSTTTGRVSKADGASSTLVIQGFVVIYIASRIGVGVMIVRTSDGGSSPVAVVVHSTGVIRVISSLHTHDRIGEASVASVRPAREGQSLSRRLSPTSTFALACVLIATGAGCGGGSGGAPTATSPPPTGPNDLQATTARPAPYPQPTAGADRAARELAVAAMKAFVSDAAPRKWWQRLSPMLSAQARFDYEGTDPAEVPAHRVLGGAVSMPSRSAFLARIAVPTDAGRYVVLLSRSGAASPWRVERLTPPRTTR